MGRRTQRTKQYIYYLKDGEAIADFLAYIGANTAAFDFMNSRIEREFRNNINRQVNCDTANIEKQLRAVRKYNDVIGQLVASDKIDSLPAELRETAILRLENEQLSLTDIGKLLKPPVSKSGVKHRLDKIMALAEDILKTV